MEWEYRCSSIKMEGFSVNMREIGTEIGNMGRGDATSPINPTISDR